MFHLEPTVVYKYVEIIGLIFVVIHIYKQIKGCPPTQLNFYPAHWPQRSSSRVFDWLVVAKQSTGYCATLWRLHNRDEYYCVGLSHILVKKHVLLNLIQFSHNFTLFIAKKKYVIFAPSPTWDLVRFGSTPSPKHLTQFRDAP